MPANFCPQCGQPLHAANVNGQPRQRCIAIDCGYVHWDNPVPVVAAIVELDGTVILARNKSWPEKMYGLITGFLEKGRRRTWLFGARYGRNWGWTPSPPISSVTTPFSR